MLALIIVALIALLSGILVGYHYHAYIAANAALAEQRAKADADALKQSAQDAAKVV